MSRYISTIILALIVGLPSILLSQTQDPPEKEDGSETDWESLAAENEDILNWGNDPLAELGLDLGPAVIWSTSIAAGLGYSDNFLKRENRTGSRFLKLESDFFITGLFERSSFLAFIYAEGIKYDFDTDVDSEAIVLLHANWKRSGSTWIYGTELDLFYGNQIFDASLTSTANPVGDRLRQFRPTLTFFMERTLGRKDSLRLSLDTERVLYERSEDDYWHPSLEVDWERKWINSILTTTTVGYFEEHYDEEVSLDKRGFDMPSKELLLIRGIRGEEEISWTPSFLEKLKLTARAGASLEEDTEGDYYDAVRIWGTLITDLDLTWIELNLSGRWQSTLYKSRQVDFFDTRPQEQIYRSLRIEAERSLPWNFSIRLGVEWNDFNSRISYEQFSERRVEILLNWSY